MKRKRLRLLMEYGCYPVWIYDENGEILDTQLPDELSDDKELDAMFTELQNIFNGLYIDTPIEFSYRGFETEDDRQYFINLLIKATDLLAERIGERYILDFRHLDEWTCYLKA